MIRRILAVAACFALSGCGSFDAGGTEASCEVAIIGGGAGGLHTAFRLAPTRGANVCLFEKEDTLGGRIHDVSFDGNESSPLFGTGARRIAGGQQVLFDLATELGIETETPTVTADLISARGGFGFSSDDLLPLYPNIPQTPGKEVALYDALRFGSQRALAETYPDFRSYIRDVVGEEEYEFLRDMSRFRADFEYPLDARGYLDYLDEEWDVSTLASYPIGGMSAFIRGMESSAVANGARIFKSEPVTSIESENDYYLIHTAKRTMRVYKVIIAVPPVALDQITGDVAAEIRAQPQYQELIGVRVVTITQWWDTDWWTQINNPGLMANNQVWRGWTTEHCLNFIEIPLNAYAVAQKVTRSVYDDDIRCVAFWEEAAKKGRENVEAEINRGLTYLFNGNSVTAPAMVTIPTPLKTHVQVWPAAWHWLRAGATHTNAEISDWAVEPLAGRSIALVGEAYNPQRSGWSDAAYKSSIKLLNAKYGLNLPGLTTSPLRARHGASRGH